MNAGCYGGETWRYVARVEVLTRDGTLRACARRPSTRSATASVQRARRRAARRDLHRRRGSAFPQGDATRGARAHQGAARAAHRHAAAVAAERRQRVPQSAGRPRGAADRSRAGSRATRSAARACRTSTRTSSSIPRARASAADIEALIAHVRDDGAREDRRRARARSAHRRERRA